MMMMHLMKSQYISLTTRNINLMVALEEKSDQVNRIHPLEP